MSSGYPTLSQAIEGVSTPGLLESKLINYYSVNDPPNNDIFNRTFSTSNFIDNTEPDLKWYKINSLDGNSLTLKHYLFCKLSDKDKTEKTSVEQHTHICESNGEHNHGTRNWDDETAPPSISMVPFIKY